jgi:hypothetical protein
LFATWVGETLTAVESVLVTVSVTGARGGTIEEVGVMEVEGAGVIDVEGAGTGVGAGTPAIAPASVMFPWDATMTAASATVMAPDTVAGAALELNTAPLPEMPVPATTSGLLSDAPLRSSAPPDVIWIEPPPSGTGDGAGVGAGAGLAEGVGLGVIEGAGTGEAAVGMTTPPVMIVSPV